MDEEFVVGEEVLCYEPNANNLQTLFISEIKDKGRYCITEDDREVVGNKYLIHFWGWRSNKDRWVTEDFLLKMNEENLELRRQLAKEAGIVLKDKGQKRGRKPKNTVQPETDIVEVYDDDKLPCNSTKAVAPAINTPAPMEKKKRGRKPKNAMKFHNFNTTTAIDSPGTSANQNGGPRKRGRKPKKAVYSNDVSDVLHGVGINTSDTIEIDNGNVGSRTRGRKCNGAAADSGSIRNNVSDTSDGAVGINTSDTIEIGGVKRRRCGRKPKNSVESNIVVNDVSEVPVGAVSINTSDTIEIGSIKRRRGRKPKNSVESNIVLKSVSDVLDGVVSINTSDTIEISSIKRRRGRKPKISVESNIVLNSVSDVPDEAVGINTPETIEIENVEPQTCGRKCKSAAVDSEIILIDVPNVPDRAIVINTSDTPEIGIIKRRRRGRKPKNSVESNMVLNNISGVPGVVVSVNNTGTVEIGSGNVEPRTRSRRCKSAVVDSGSVLNDVSNISNEGVDINTSDTIEIGGIKRRRRGRTPKNSVESNVVLESSEVADNFNTITSTVDSPNSNFVEIVSLKNRKRKRKISDFAEIFADTKIIDITDTSDVSKEILDKNDDKESSQNDKQVRHQEINQDSDNDSSSEMSGTTEECHDPSDSDKISNDTITVNTTDTNDVSSKEILDKFDDEESSQNFEQVEIPRKNQDSDSNDSSSEIPIEDYSLDPSDYTNISDTITINTTDISDVSQELLEKSDFEEWYQNDIQIRHAGESENSDSDKSLKTPRTTEHSNTLPKYATDVAEIFYDHSLINTMKTSDREIVDMQLPGSSRCSSISLSLENFDNETQRDMEGSVTSEVYEADGLFQQSAGIMHQTSPSGFSHISNIREIITEAEILRSAQNDMEIGSPGIPRNAGVGVSGTSNNVVIIKRIRSKRKKNDKHQLWSIPSSSQYSKNSFSNECQAAGKNLYSDFKRSSITSDTPQTLKISREGKDDVITATCNAGKSNMFNLEGLVNTTECTKDITGTLAILNSAAQGQNIKERKKFRKPYKLIIPSEFELLLLLDEKRSKFENKVVKLPSTPCIAVILEMFVRQFASKHLRIYAAKKNGAVSYDDLCKEVEKCKEMAKSIMVFCDFMAESHLCIYPEVLQYYNASHRLIKMSSNDVNEENMRFFEEYERASEMKEPKLGDKGERIETPESIVSDRRKSILAFNKLQENKLHKLNANNKKCLRSLSCEGRYCGDFGVHATTNSEHCGKNSGRKLKGRKRQRPSKSKIPCQPKRGRPPTEFCEQMKFLNITNGRYDPEEIPIAENPRYNLRDWVSGFEKNLKKVLRSKLKNWTLLPENSFSKSSVPTVSKIYGAILLARVIICLPKFFKLYNFTREQILENYTYIQVLIRYMVDHRNWFSATNYTKYDPMTHYLIPEPTGEKLYWREASSDEDDSENKEKMKEKLDNILAFNPVTGPLDRKLMDSCDDFNYPQGAEDPPGETAAAKGIITIDLLDDEYELPKDDDEENNPCNDSSSNLTTTLNEKEETLNVDEDNTINASLVKKCRYTTTENQLIDSGELGVHKGPIWRTSILELCSLVSSKIPKTDKERRSLEIDEMIVRNLVFVHNVVDSSYTFDTYVDETTDDEDGQSLLDEYSSRKVYPIREKRRIEEENRKCTKDYKNAWEHRKRRKRKEHRYNGRHGHRHHRAEMVSENHTVTQLSSSESECEPTVNCATQEEKSHVKARSVVSKGRGKLDGRDRFKRRNHYGGNKELSRNKKRIIKKSKRSRNILDEGTSAIKRKRDIERNEEEENSGLTESKETVDPEGSLELRNVNKGISKHSEWSEAVERNIKWEQKRWKRAHGDNENFRRRKGDERSSDNQAMGVSEVHEAGQKVEVQLTNREAGRDEVVHLTNCEVGRNEEVQPTGHKSLRKGSINFENEKHKDERSATYNKRPADVKTIYNYGNCCAVNSSLYKNVAKKVTRYFDLPTRKQFGMSNIPGNVEVAESGEEDNVVIERTNEPRKLAMDSEVSFRKVIKNEMTNRANDPTSSESKRHNSGNDLEKEESSGRSSTMAVKSNVSSDDSETGLSLQSSSLLSNISERSIIIPGPNLKSAHIKSPTCEKLYSSPRPAVYFNRPNYINGFKRKMNEDNGDHDNETGYEGNYVRNEEIGSGRVEHQLPVDNIIDDLVNDTFTPRNVSTKRRINLREGYNELKRTERRDSDCEPDTSNGQEQQTEEYEYANVVDIASAVPELHVESHEHVEESNEIPEVADRTEMVDSDTTIHIACSLPLKNIELFKFMQLCKKKKL